MIFRGLKDDMIAGLKRLRSPVDLRDLMVFGGIGMVGYGISLVHPPAAWVVVGVSLFWLGVR